jgi:hypothetical protein
MRTPYGAMSKGRDGDGGKFHAPLPRDAAAARNSNGLNPRHELTRLECSTPEGTLDSTIRYYTTPVMSIYDLGVPRSTPNVEARTTGRREGPEQDRY